VKMVHARREFQRESLAPHPPETRWMGVSESVLLAEAESNEALDRHVLAELADRGLN
jgi:hypothetical protein